MQIIDGYCNEPNIFADDIGEYNTAIWGTRDCVLPAGERLGYELVSNNEIKIKDGVFSTQGRRGVIKKGTTETCIIKNGTQAENRNDLIVIEYSKDSSTLVESHTLKVIKGIPGETATDPDVVTGDIQAGDVLHQMPLYRVKLEGLNVVAVEQMFTVGNVEQPEMMKKINAQNEKLEKMNANMSGLTFAQDADGNWGYKVGGADPVIPFGGNLKPLVLKASQSYTADQSGYVLAFGAAANGNGSNLCSVTIKKNGNAVTPKFATANSLKLGAAWIPVDKGDVISIIPKGVNSNYQASMICFI